MTMRLIIAYLLNLFDLAATTYLVNRFSLEVEANPIGRWLFETGLVYPVKVIGIGAALIALYAGVKRHPRWRWVSWVVLAAYSVLAAYHIISIFLFLKKE